ncbi:MAG TPA: hypothetical protein VHE81_09100 [Lacipirellulaceae bacterium]|nr:hypothetical protein [Lacipirellulaceae bacterium]
MLTQPYKKAGSRRGAVSRDEALSERRKLLRERPDHTFVRRDEFCRLLLSNKKLVRSDEPGVRLRGLLDLESGERYLIEQEELFTSYT